MLKRTLVGDFCQKEATFGLIFSLEKILMNRDRRRESRFNSKNLISYVCVDENNQKHGQGMGRTLNISEGGILLETHVSIDPKSSISLTIALEEDLVEIEGKVAFSKRKKEGKYETGIHFSELDGDKRRFLRYYVAVFEKTMMSNRGEGRDV